MAAKRADVDDVAALFEQMGHGGPGAADQGDQVQFHQVAELLGRGVEQLAAHGAAGVVDQDVEPAESLEGLGEEAIDVFLLRDVGMDAEDVMAGGLHFGGGLFDGVGLQADDGEFGAGGGEAIGDDAAQAAGAAGDENDFVLPVIHVQ